MEEKEPARCWLMVHTLKKKKGTFNILYIMLQGLFFLLLWRDAVLFPFLSASGPRASAFKEKCIHLNPLCRLHLPAELAILTLLTELSFSLRCLFVLTFNSHAWKNILTEDEDDSGNLVTSCMCDVFWLWCLIISFITSCDIEQTTSLILGSDYFCLLTWSLCHIWWW